MKEITMTKKAKVIKLFLAGLSYEEIVHQVGVAKGSVVNIIDEFRDGNLPLPWGVVGYVDELRHVAVDMKKHGTTIPQLKTYLKLHTKLQEMDVSSEQVEEWLDICQDIAAPAASNSQFVQAALQLAQLTVETGCDYPSLIDEYQDKVGQVEALGVQIEQQEQESSDLKHKFKEEKEQATKQLSAINEAIATAQETFHQQKKELKSQMDEYLVQNKLSWDKINTVWAILQAVLGNEGLNQADIETVSKEVADAGSMVVFHKQLEQKIMESQSKVDVLVQQKATFTSSVNNLGDVNNKLIDSILQKGQEKEALDAQLKEQKAKLAQLKEIASGYIDDLYITRLVMGALIVPEGLSDHDIDELVRLMIYLRQQRLGIGPQEVKDGNGKVICQCKVPKLYLDTKDYETNMGKVRKRLARCLMPLVQDEFVSKFEYSIAQLAELQQSVLQLESELQKRLPPS